MTDRAPTVSTPPPVLKSQFLAGETFAGFLTRPKKNSELWDALYKRASVAEPILARARIVKHAWHLLVLSEDWCGDSINTLPVIARLTEVAPLLDMRIIGREANPDLMNAHLTGVSRSIPVIMVLDSNYGERGWWGPRPASLQEWVMGHLALPKEEQYREVRRWYARDHGATALNEVLDIIERAESTEERAETAG